MDVSTPRPLSYLNLDHMSGDSSVQEHLGVLVTTAIAVVPSLLAVEVVLIRDSCSVVLHARGGPLVEPGASRARTSLRLPVCLLPTGLEAGGYVVLYARDAGALVDLAADAAYVLGKDGIVLDGDLPPWAPAPGVVGLAELTVIERAHGVLIERGHDPSEVAAILRGQAAEAGLDPYAFALEVLDAAH